MVAARTLCWNCDGDIDTAVDSCPYCGVEAAAASSQQGSTVYTPPYQLASDPSQQPPPPPYTGGGAPQTQWESAGVSSDAQAAIQSHDEDLKSVLLPTVMLLAGSVFLLFGLAMSLFHHDGIFTLRWNARYALFYLASALPLLYFGWQALSRMKES